MQEELQRRNYSEATAVCYVRHVAEFAQFFRRSPDSLGAEEIKQFQLHLIHQKKVSWSTYIQATAALRFFYIKTIGQAFMAEKIPFPKRPVDDHRKTYFLELRPRRHRRGTLGNGSIH
jgi:site-specific recombinase XerD